MNIWTLLGTIGALIVSYSNLPQLYLFYKQGHAIGISHSSMWVGTVGLMMRTAFLMHETKFNIVVLGPYYFALLCTLYTFYYMYFPRKVIPKLPRKDGIKRLQRHFRKLKLRALVKRESQRDINE